MIKHEIVTEKGRARYVRVPIEEWRRLERHIEELESAADVRAYDAAKAAGGESIPGGVVHAILDGENPVKTLRAWRGRTQAELAATAGVSTLFISQIENGRRTGSVKTLRAIATALSQLDCGCSDCAAPQHERGDYAACLALIALSRSKVV